MDKKTKTITVEFFGVQITTQFVVKEDGVVVDTGQVNAPPLFTIPSARKWLLDHEKTILETVKKQRA